MAKKKNGNKENQQEIPDSHGIGPVYQFYWWRGVFIHNILVSVASLLLKQENVAISTELSTFMSFPESTVQAVFSDHLTFIIHYIMDCGCFKEKP